MLGRKLHGAAVARGQRRLLALPATMPNRPHRMDDVAGGQPVAFGDLGVAGGATAEVAALSQQFRAGGAMNCAVDTTTAHQRIVRGIDDGIDIKCRNVGDNDVVARRADLS